jgi:hypothetical protein
MNVSLHRGPRRGLLLLLPVLAAACTDGNPMSPVVEPTPLEAAALQCVVDVQSAGMSCTVQDPTAGQGVSVDRMVGNQDVYMKLTNVGGSYDLGTEIFEINVTVQNLMQQAIGTSDGSTVEGFKVFFFDGPSVMTGTGDVTLVNADSAFILAPNQKYFFYNQILQPNEISSSQPWQFSVPGTVGRFSFMVYVMAPQVDEMMDELDRVWDGSTSTDWTDGTNWVDGVAPDSASAVAVPADSLFAGNMPALTADAQLTHLRVGFASTLTLNGNTLTAWGNVDAVGSITGGTLWVRGADALLKGNLPSVRVSGAASLQGATKASGAVSVSDGSLVVNGSSPLSISIP